METLIHRINYNIYKKEHEKEPMPDWEQVENYLLEKTL